MQTQSLNPASACQFDVTGEHFVCKNCGLRVPTRLFAKGKPFVACAHAQRSPSASVTQPSRPPVRGLGDLLSDGLSAVGITKDRVGAVARAAGVKDCGCGKRQKWVNKMGAKYLGLPEGSTAQNTDSPTSDSP